MSINIVTFGTIGGLSAPQGPASIIEGPLGVSVKVCIPDALLIQSVDGTDLYPYPAGVSSADYRPTSVSVRSLNPQPTKVEQGG